MTSRQAGETASRAGAKRLMLTHIWPTLDVVDMEREVEETFDGEVLPAREGMTVSLGGG
jgi:ribonuclease BN (tRNA processing enzyme)